MLTGTDKLPGGHIHLALRLFWLLDSLAVQGNQGNSSTPAMAPKLAGFERCDRGEASAHATEWTLT